MKWRRFGREIFRIFEAYPLVMNTIVGGVLYAAGEVTVQVRMSNNWSQLFKREDFEKVFQIGALGALENGLMMSTWYKFLNYCVGSGVFTRIVLIKCFLDQIFFATQQDFLFLALCAYSQSGDISLALTDIKESFVTTWIMDCSLWPLVNFLGFIFVPCSLQPTYMATISYFWQLYISGAAAKERALEHDKLVKLFNDIDLDNNHVLDSFELKAALTHRGVNVSNEDIKKMIRDADASPIDSEGPRIKGKVTFEEFEVMVSSQSSSDHWRTILKRAPLVKGSKKAIEKFHELNTKKQAKQGELKQKTDLSSPASNKMENSTHLPQENSNFPDRGSVSDPTTETSNLSERENALQNVKWSLSILTAIALFRRMILKI